MNMDLKSLRISITTSVVFFIQTSTLDVCYAYRYVLQSGKLPSIWLLHRTRAVPRKIHSVCTAASLVLALAYGVYKISPVFERGSTNIHFPAGVAICRSFSTSGS